MHRFGGGLGGPRRVGGNSTTLTLLWVEHPCLDRAEESRSSLALGCDTPAGGVFNGPIRDATMTRSRCRARAACLLPTIKVRQEERRDEGSGRMVRGAQYTYLKRLRRVRSLLLLLLALLIARYVEAQAIERWMTPSGSIYFGHNPPPGSTLLGVVGDVEPSIRGDAPRDLPHPDHDSASMFHLLVINRRQNADYETDSCNRGQRSFKAPEPARSFAKSVVENAGQKHYRDCQHLWRELYEEQRTFPLLRRRMVSEQRGTDQEARSPLSAKAAAHRTGRLGLGPQGRARRP